MALQLSHFKKVNMPEFLNICVESYVETNLYLLLGVLTPEQFRKQTQETIQMFVDGAQIVNNKLNRKTMFNTFIEIDGVMARAGFSCQLHHYVNTISKHLHDELFFNEFLTTYLASTPQGTAVVSIREVTNKSYYRRGLMKNGIIEKSKHLVSQGYIYDFVFTSNQVSLKVMTSLGAVVMKQFPNQIKGITMNLFIMKRDMRIAAAMKYSQEK